MTVDLLLEALRHAFLIASLLSPSTKDEPGDMTQLLSSGYSGTSGTLTINNLDPKPMPVMVEADADAKDFKVKGRRKFKPAKGDESAGPLNQLELRAKRDDASVCVVTEFKGFGSLDTWVRLSVDKTTGLVDGTSLGFFGVRHDTGEGTLVNRLEAVWNAGIDGFSVRTDEAGEAAGAPVEFPGEHSLMLFITQAGTDLELSAAVAGPFAFDWTDRTVVNSTTVPSDTDEYCLSFGARGLGKKGTLYFVDLVLNGDLTRSDLSLGEQELQGLLQYAALCCGNAEIFSDPQGGLDNLFLARDWAGLGVLAWDESRTQFDALAANETITGNRAKLLDKSIGKGVKSAEQAFKIADKLIDKGAQLGDTSKSVEKAGQKGRNQADLATGQLMGLNTKNVDHVYDFADF